MGFRNFFMSSLSLGGGGAQTGSAPPPASLIDTSDFTAVGPEANRTINTADSFELFHDGSGAGLFVIEGLANDTYLVTLTTALASGAANIGIRLRNGNQAGAFLGSFVTAGAQTLEITTTNGALTIQPLADTYGASVTDFFVEAV